MGLYIYDPPMALGAIDYDLYNVSDWLWKALVPTVDQLYATMLDQQNQLTAQQQQLQTQQTALQNQQNAMQNALTQEAVTVTLTASGFVGSVTQASVYLRQGRMASLTFPSITGTSNSTVFTISGLTSARAPLYTLYQLALGNDNTMATLCYVQLDTAGLITVYRLSVNVIDAQPNPGYLSQPNWTASGSKGVSATCLSWALP